MNARRTLLAVAAAAAMAATTSAALAFGPGMRGANCPAQADCPMAGSGPMAGPGPMGAGPRGGMGMRGDPAAAGARLEQLKAALQLQPNQTGAWNAYETRVKAQADERAKLREGMLNLKGDAQALADHRVAMLKQRAAAAEEINTLRKSLYASLTAEQKAAFDQFRPGGGAKAGRHAHRHGSRS